MLRPQCPVSRQGGNTLRHHETRAGSRLGQRIQQGREGPLQPEDQSAVIGGKNLLRGTQQHAAKAIARRPAPNAGHAIRRPHRLTIMPAQIVAQADLPAQPIGGNTVSLGHLRLWPQLPIGAIQRVKHAKPMRGDNGGGIENRVQRRNCRLRHEAQGSGPRGLRNGWCGGRSGQKNATLHPIPSIWPPDEKWHRGPRKAQCTLPTPVLTGSGSKVRGMRPASQPRQRGSPR